MTRTEQIIAGLQLLLQLDPKASTAAEHDEIIVHGALHPKPVGPENIVRLDELGWRWNEDYQGWVRST